MTQKPKIIMVFPISMNHNNFSESSQFAVPIRRLLLIKQNRDAERTTESLNDWNRTDRESYEKESKKKRRRQNISRSTTASRINGPDAKWEKNRPNERR